jgi:quercetin dioxygenase-like cupin family protein
MRYKVDNVNNYTGTKGWICGHFIPEGVQKNSELEVKYEVLNPGYAFPPHYHPQGTEVILIIKGKLKIQIEGEDIILGDGDFVFMQNNVTEAFLEVYEPTTVISIRTPSIPNNKISKDRG